MLSDNLRKIEHLLLELGLNQSDIAVFFSLLEVWASTIAQISQQTGYGRITTHEIVRRLISHGLLLETYSGKKRLVYPNELTSLERLVEQRKNNVQKLQQELHAAQGVLQSLMHQAENFPKMRYFRGKEGIKLMIAEMLQDRENIFIMSDGQHFYDLIDNEFLEKSLEMRNKYRLVTSIMFPNGFDHFVFTQGTYEQTLRIKFLPEQQLPKWGLAIRGNKLSFHVYEGKFLSSTFIEDATIASLIKWLFDQTFAAN